MRGVQSSFFSRALTCVVSTAVALGGLQAMALATPPASVVGQAAPSAPITEKPDPLSASLAAKTTGDRVEVTSARTERATTFANPDGTFTVEGHTGQIRFREKGKWRDVDLTLVAGPDGVVAPRGHALGLKLAGKSSSAQGVDLVSIAEPGARTVTLAWPGALPKPVLKGERATYADVQPGVDLVLEARRSGFEQFFVLDERPGDSAAVSWSFALKTKGLTARPEANGSVSFVDGKGKVVSVIPAATAWDAKTDERTGEHSDVSKVALTVTQKSPGLATLTITPDAGWLADPETVFPVTVDPTYMSATRGTTFDTYVQQGTTTSQHASTELKLGNNGSGQIARSLLEFELGSLKGKVIKSAELRLHEVHSWSCSARSWEAWSISGDVTTSTVWSNQPTPSLKYGASTQTKGHDAGCPAGTVAVPLGNMVQLMANDSAVTNRLMLRAANESDEYAWKRFASSETSSDPTMVVTFNRPPAIPSGFTIGSSATYNSSTYTRDLTPDLIAKATDPDANTVQMQFQVHTSTAADAGSLLASCNSPYVAAGTNGSCVTPTTLNDNTTYYVRARSFDNMNTSHWSGLTAFKTAAAAPTTPTITCTGYANAGWTTTKPAADVPCRISATGTGNTAPTDIRYSIDGATPKTVPITPSTQADVAKVDDFIKAVDGGHSIEAWSYSASDAPSAGATFGHGFGEVGITNPVKADTFVTTGNVAVEAVGPPNGSGATPTATLQWRISSSGQGEGTEASNNWNDAKTLTATAVSGTWKFAGTWDSMAAVRDAKANLDLDTRVPVLLDLQVCVTYTSGIQCTWSGTPRTVRRVPHAFGNGFPVAAAGPGEVALWTGEFSTTATDVVIPGYNGALAISRNHTTFAGATTPSTGVFGPGWTASLDGPDAGLAGVEVIDNTRLDGTLVLLGADGTPMFFAPTAVPTRRTAANLSTGTYVPVDEETKLLHVKVAVTGTGTGAQVVITEPDGVITTFGATAAASVSTAAIFAALSVAEPGVPGATTYTRDAAGRITRILAALPTGMTAADCPATGTMQPGCRALTITYTPPNPSNPVEATEGDVAGQVKKIEATLYNPATSAMLTQVMATYKYNLTSGRLVEVTDNVSQLSTKYAYTDTRLTQITAPGTTPFTLEYAGADNKLARIKRATPATAGGGTATLATVLYGVPLSGTGLPTMTDAAVEAWGQLDQPTYAAAVFGPDKPVTTLDPISVASGDWKHAGLSYTDARGFTVNTANHGADGTNQVEGEGWLPTYTDYDELGNVILELDTADIAAVKANALSTLQAGTKTVYNTGTATLKAGSVVTDVYGPVRTVTKADGTTQKQRPHTHTTFDEGTPVGAPTNPLTGMDWALPTTQTITAANADATADLAGPALTVTKTEYGTSEADWQRGAPTKVTTPMGGAGPDISNVTSYDAEGRVTAQRQPKSDGTDAGTRLTVYYTKAANATHTECGGKPEWAGLICLTKYAGAPSAGPVLPVTRATGFNWLLAPTTSTETADGAVRTTTTTYDDKLRVSTLRTTLTGVAGSTPVNGSEVEYDNSTGSVVNTWETNASGARTGARVATTYDDWGRQVTYSPESGDITTTVYDNVGRVASVQDSKGTTTYTYDGSDANGRVENRGLVTRMEVTRTGGGPLVFTGAYDIDGTLTTEKLPGGITRRTQFDEAGNNASLTYSGQVGTETDEPWLGWSQDHDLLNRVVREWTPSGAAFAGNLDEGSSTAAAYSRAYTYDSASRLTKAVDKTLPIGQPLVDPETPGLEWDLLGTVCETRDYAFDANGNRTSRTTTGHNTDGTCATTGGTTKTWGYDTADRISAGYAYDKLGRATTLPAVDAPAGAAAGNITLGYYDNDAARTIAQNGTTTTFTLDASGRRSVEAVGPDGGPATKSLVRHYTDAGDNPAWVDQNEVSGSSTTRYISGLTGDLGATITTGGTDAGVEIPVVDPHGDTPTVIEVPNDLTAAVSIETWVDTDEYGNPVGVAEATNDTVTEGVGYGWLGAKERATTDSGLILMGARLYNRATGQFTSVDPVFGGNSSPSTYPQDPVNSFDLDGRFGFSSWSLAKLVLKGARSIIKVVAKGCGRLVNPALSIGCTMGTGAAVGVITYALANGKNFSGTGAATAAALGAGQAMWERYGKTVARFLFKTKWGKKVIKAMDKNKYTRRAMDGLEKWMDKRDFT